MKRHALPLAAGILAGGILVLALAVFGFIPRGPSLQEKDLRDRISALIAEVEMLKASLKDKSAQLDKLRLAKTRETKKEKENKDPLAGLIGQLLGGSDSEEDGEDAPKEGPDFGKLMGSLIGGFIKNMDIDAMIEDDTKVKIADLTVRLGLSEEQAENVRALIEEEIESKRDVIDALKKGELNFAEMEALGTESDEWRDRLDEVLTAEQLESNEQYEEERQRNELEISASNQLNELQSMLNLSDEQKDEAYTAFYEIDQQRLTGNPGDTDGGDPETEALSEILSEEQMDLYRAKTEQKRNNEARFLKGFGRR